MTREFHVRITKLPFAARYAHDTLCLQTRIVRITLYDTHCQSCSLCTRIVKAALVVNTLSFAPGSRLRQERLF